jgi:2-polyprenyl-3-methyl-5-hydroxy-6-metoxy-1,4-benzoquinol methylase
MSESKQNVKDFYDTFTDNQKKIGVSVRHRLIFKKLKEIGLLSNSNVLEIGCGIGTVSTLIIPFINAGKFVGCDISPKSFELTKKFTSQKNASFICTDITDFESQIKFDFVVFPDVLEHIPVEEHKALFERISKYCSPNAKLLINIPEPNSLNFTRKNRPEKLQIIDQSLSMQDLLNNTYPFGFQVHSIVPYSIHTNVNNYLSIVFIRNTEIKSLELVSKLKQLIQNIKARF